MAACAILSLFAAWFSVLIFSAKTGGTTFHIKPDSTLLRCPEYARGKIMDTNQMEWRSAETAMPEGPSLDFIRAVAELLETDPDDILAELGYSRTEIEEVSVV